MDINLLKELKDECIEEYKKHLVKMEKEKDLDIVSENRSLYEVYRCKIADYILLISLLEEEDFNKKYIKSLLYKEVATHIIEIDRILNNKELHLYRNFLGIILRSFINSEVYTEIVLTLYPEYTKEFSEIYKLFNYNKEHIESNINKVQKGE